MATINGSAQRAWIAGDAKRQNNLLSVLLSITIAGAHGAALGWKLNRGWSGSAAWWQWGVIGASAAALWALYRGVLLTHRGPIGASVGFGLGAACFVLLSMISPGGSGLPQLVLAGVALVASGMLIAGALKR